jgi:hypothetical protein
MSSLVTRTSVSLAPLITLLLFIAIFAGFQGGRYIMANRMQELGIFSSLLVFVLGAWVSLFRISQDEWKRWVYTPVLLVGGIMLIWSAVFALRFGESLLYCLFASREFLLAFLGPAMYLIVRSGYPSERLERVIWFSLLALMLNYLYFYFTLDLKETFFSADHTVSNLVTYDEWRGFRLKPPLFAIMLGLLGSLVLIGQMRSLGAALFALLLVGLALYIWSIVMFRATLATMLVSLCLYPLFLAARSRLPIILLVLPLVLLALPTLSQLMLGHFLSADGGGIRLKAFQLALESIPRYLLLGVGEDNAYGRTYQDLFAFYFYPSDLGFVGITFKYGIVGAGLYLFIHFTIWWRLLASNWRYRLARKQLQPLLWALLIFFTAQTFNLVLNPGLAYAQGITVGTMALALCGIVDRQLSN